MRLLGMTDDGKRKGPADYVSPTLVTTRQNSAGFDGMLAAIRSWQRTIIRARPPKPEP